MKRLMKAKRKRQGRKRIERFTSIEIMKIKIKEFKGKKKISLSCFQQITCFGIAFLDFTRQPNSCSPFSDFLSDIS